VEFEGASADGRRIFFMSYQQLVPEDTDNALDIYESFDGQATLISKGPNNENVSDLCSTCSKQLSISRDGRRAVFNTKARLLPQDTDDQRDAYEVTANEPPSCGTAYPTPAALRPANHKFRRVDVRGASDPDGDSLTVRVTGVTQDEPTGSSADALPTAAPDQVRLRAERDARGNGRVYRIAFTATDSFGASCSGTVTVGVPHGGQAAVDSAPPSYDSFGP
jgi:hypothetical protein